MAIIIASNTDERIHSLVGVLPLLPVLSRHLASCAGTVHRFTDCHIILSFLIIIWRVIQFLQSVILVHKCFVCHFVYLSDLQGPEQPTKIWDCGKVMSPPHHHQNMSISFWKCWMKKCQFQSNECFSDLASWILCRCWQSPPPRWFSRPPSWWLPGGFQQWWCNDIKWYR